MDAQQRIFKALRDIYDDLVAMVKQNGETIVPKSGHILYSQYTGLYFAKMYTESRFQNPYYQDDATLALAIRCWDFFYSLTDEDGTTALVTFDNDWGRCVDEWGVFHWMNTMAMLGTHLPEQTRQRWQARIEDIMMKKVVPGVKKQLASNRFRYELARHEVSNHFCWHVVATYRFGQLNTDASIMKIADDVMDLIAQGQTVTGTWYEGKTLVAKYATVTIGALSKYYFFSKKPRIFEALSKSFHYMAKLMYPDFSVTAAIDSRNRYGTRFAPMNFPAAYSHLKDCETMIGALTSAVCSVLQNRPFQGSTQGIAMLVEHLDDINRSIPVTSVDRFDLYPDTVTIPEENVLILKKNKWHVPMCCQPICVFGSRWILERQNLFDVYHEECGLIMGGGHSIAQPQLSTWNVISHGKVHYTHEAGMITDENDGMCLRYGERECTVRFAFDEQYLHIAYQVKQLLQTERGIVNIPLYTKMGDMITVDGTSHTCGREHFAVTVPKGASVQYKGVAMRLSKEAVLSYPLLPYNSYVVKHGKSFDETFAILTMEFEHDQTKLDVTVEWNGDGPKKTS